MNAVLKSEVVLICWKLEAQWDLIGLLLWALNPFKMILFWGLKKFPLRREIPALKDHLNFPGYYVRVAGAVRVRAEDSGGP